jgi:hypothetical protein
MDERITRLSEAKISRKDREFADSLIGNYQKRGKLSEKQWYWVTKLSTPKCQHMAGPGTKLARIRGMIDAAFEAGKKYPKIKLRSGETVVQMYRAGERSKRPGSIQVTDGDRYPDNVYFGYIGTDGEFHESVKCTREVSTLLSNFDHDPAGVAKAHADLVGSCCFCGLTLTDQRSISVGYGPICAGNHGLPWGDGKIDRTYETTPAHVESHKHEWTEARPSGACRTCGNTTLYRSQVNTDEWCCHHCSY